MGYETIESTIADGILTITLDRPGHLNAFTTLMAAELEEAFVAAGQDDDVRAIIVTGAGRAFCAGMDLSTGGNVFGIDESRTPSISEIRERFDDPDIRIGVRDAGGRVTLAIFDCPKPVIAAINGPAVGIGATMTLAMDVRLASTSARIGFVFNRLGVTPEACSTWFLPRIVGMSRALEWCLGADILDPDEALDGGLVRSVHAPDHLLPAAYALATRFMENRSQVAIALTRRMLYRNSAMAHPREAHLVESLSMLETSRADGRDGVAAFLERRPPHFRSRASELPPFAADL